jgi:uncharacterized protein YydD (DUF2326 family)
MKEKIELKNLPDKIWIQVGEIDIDFDNDFKKLRESNEVTWCEHKIDNWDIEYTRSSLIESLINQEVEKRIAERMPSEEEINKQAEQAMQRDTKDGRIGIIIDSTYYGVFCDALEWLRSRLTCSEKPNNSQKTEGGEG